VGNPELKPRVASSSFKSDEGPGGELAEKSLELARGDFKGNVSLIYERGNPNKKISPDLNPSNLHHIGGIDVDENVRLLDFLALAEFQAALDHILELLTA
jgi:hypothetical protein